jgi:hypothetical protein
LANVVDALVVTFGLDATNFKRGSKDAQDDLKKTREAANTTAKNMEQSGKQAAMFYTKIRNEVMGLFAIFTAGRGIKEFTRDTVNSDAALGRFSKNINIGVEQMSALEGAVRSLGGTSGEADSSVKSLSDEFTKLSETGSSDVIQYFRRLGIQIADASGKQRDMTAIYADLADKFAGMTPQQANFFGNAMGQSQGMINLLMKGRAEFLKSLEQQKKLGVVTKEQAARAQELQTAWVNTQTALDRFGQTILYELTPVIIDLLKWFDRWIEKNGAWVKTRITAEVKKFATYIKEIDWRAVATGIGKFVIGVGSLIGGIEGAIHVAEVFFGIWAAVNVSGLILQVIRMVMVFNSLRAAIIGSSLAMAGGAGGGLMGLLKGAAPLLLRVAPGAAFLAEMWPKTTADDTQDPELKAYRQRMGLPDTRAPAASGTPAVPAGPASNIAPSGPDKTKPTNADALIRAAANHWGIDPGLLDRQWDAESGRSRPDQMLSPAGAVGPYQFKDDAASDYHLTDRMDLGKSAEAAAHYLADLRNQFGGDIRKAVAAYNWGPGNLSKDIAAHGDQWEQFLPHETTGYLGKILGGQQAMRSGQRGASQVANNNHHEVHIAQISVHTKAMDATGIAKDIGARVKQYAFAAQVNTGLA